MTFPERLLNRDGFSRWSICGYTLRSDRPYRNGWPDEKALQYIREQSEKHFDAKVVEVFLGLDP